MVQWKILLCCCLLRQAVFAETKAGEPLPDGPNIIWKPNWEYDDVEFWKQINPKSAEHISHSEGQNQHSVEHVSLNSVEHGLHSSEHNTQSVEHISHEVDDKSADSIELGYKPVYESQKPIRPPTVHETIHVHHVPVQIPVHTSIIIHDKPSKPRGSQGYQCAAPNNLGPHKLLKSVYAHLPLEQIKNIVKAALKSDPEVAHLKDVMLSQEFREKLKALKVTRDWRILSGYACESLYLDLNYYIDFLKTLINFEALNENDLETATGDSITSSGGIRGLLNEIYTVLPKEQLKKIYKEQKQQDIYLTEAVDRLKSAEFLQLWKNVEQNVDYQAVKNMLVDSSVRLEQWQQVVDAALGRA